ncbi:MAG: hypothetical protein WBB45_11970 [Cyclobacteriaceae bacterium]
MKNATFSNYHHCNFCSNKKLDTYKGSYCGITGEKPNFSTTCQKISFRDDLEETIKAYYRVEDEKTPALIHLFMYLAFSIAAAYGAYFVTNLFWEYGWVSGITLVLAPIPLVLLRMAVTPIFTYRKERNIAVKNLRELDAVLALYGIHYTVTDIKADKDMHGNKDYYLTLQFSKVAAA